MSGQQATLATFDTKAEPELEDAHETRQVDSSAWDIDDAPDPQRCLNCGAHVSDSMRRVYGVGEDDHVTGCVNCKPQRWLSDGGTVPGRDVKGTVEERFE